MKNIIRLSSVLFVVLFLAVGSGQVQAQDTGKKDIVIVEVLYYNETVKDSRGIYVYYPDDHVEVIPLTQPKSREGIIEERKKLRNLMSKMYNEGWIIESTVSIGAEEVYILSK